MKQTLRRAINAMLEPRGFQLTRFVPELQSRGMISDQLLTLQSAMFVSEVNSALKSFGFTPPEDISVEEASSFSHLLRSCPVRQQAGGGGHNMAMLLWYMAKCIQPSEIIESGVFRGFSTWVLRNAAPLAKVVSCDVSFAELKWRDELTEYHCCDWAKVVPSCHGSTIRRMVFFDDHQSQWKRIREASERGVEFAIFDDSYPSWCLHADADAAFPTIDMLFDRGLHDGQEVVWRTECGMFRYSFDSAEADATRNLIAAWVRLPSLHAIFGYKPANLVAVRLKS